MERSMKKLVKAVMLVFNFTFEYKDDKAFNSRGYDIPTDKGYGNFHTYAVTVQEALKAFYAEHGSKERLVITNIETEPTYTEKNFYN